MEISFCGKDSIDVPHWVNDNYYRKRNENAYGRHDASTSAERRRQPQKGTNHVGQKQVHKGASPAGRRQTTAPRYPEQHSAVRRNTCDRDVYISKSGRHKTKKNGAKGLIAAICTCIAIAGGTYTGVKQSEDKNIPQAELTISQGTVVEPEIASPADLTQLEAQTIYQNEDFEIEKEEPSETTEPNTKEIPECFDFECNLNKDQQYSVEKFLENWHSNKERYENLEAITGKPAELIAAIHWRESSGDFNTCLQDGTPLGEKITSPACAGKTYYSFEDSAIDILLNDDYFGNMNIEKGDYEAYLDFAEKYNGTGYKGYSPYVWAGSTKYISGKYIKDGEYDPNFKDEKQVGVAILLKSIFTENEE